MNEFGSNHLMMIGRVIIFAFFVLILCVKICLTSHFQGGTITYKIVADYGSTISVMITQTYMYKYSSVPCDNSLIASQSSPNLTSYPDYTRTLICISNCGTSGGYSPIPVLSYCTDYSIPMDISVTQRSDVVNLTNGSYFTVAYNA